MYAGVIIAIHFAIFALSGLPLLFQEEIQNAFRDTKEQTSAPLTAEAVRLSYENILENALAKFPNDRPLAIFPDESSARRVQVRLGIDGSEKFRGARKLSYDLMSLEQTDDAQKVERGFFAWMLTLHRELFLGSWGKIYIGIVGLVYVAMLLAGFIIYGRFMKGRRFGEIRAATRTQKLRDFHRFIGMITFGWGLVVGLSGAFLGLNSVLIKLYQAQSLKHLSQQYEKTATVVPFARLSEIIASAKQARPTSSISYIAFPNTEFSIPNHFLILMNGTDIVSSRISEIAVVEAQSTKVVEVLQLPLYLKIVMLSEPLHFGNYGGLFLKILWGCFTVLSLLVVGLGVSAFVMKRQKQGMVRLDPAKIPMKHHQASKYAIPVALTAISLVSILAALFLDGWLARTSILLLALPLLTFVVMNYGRRRDV